MTMIYVVFFNQKPEYEMRINDLSSDVVSSALDHLDVPFSRPGHARAAAGDAQQPLARGVDLARVADHEGEFAAADRDVADADPWLGAAHFGQHLLAHLLEPRTGEILGVGLEQQIAAAGKVEAQIDPRMRDRPFGGQLGSASCRERVCQYV